MTKTSVPLELPLYAYSTARSLGYALEFLALNSIASLIPGSQPPRSAPNRDPSQLWAIRRDLQELLWRDSSNIRRGIYPAWVLAPESPAAHLRRFPKLILDGYSIALRKARGRTAEFDRESSEFLQDVPRYYQRCFHFQTGGYLSRRSAEVYDHQVELLFAGGADAMRRLIIPPLKEHFAHSPDGKGLKFLELGAGTGRATRFVKLAFPRARIVAVDLSDPYLKQAQKNLARQSRVDFLQADAAHLPFKSAEFDAVYSVFLFHELPRSVRSDVLAEAKRVTRDRGFVGMVDSLQSGDKALFDPLLPQFPRDFHEPYYRDYIAQPMEELLSSERIVRQVRTELGFSSKVCWGRRAVRKLASSVLVP